MRAFQLNITINHRDGTCFSRLRDQFSEQVVEVYVAQVTGGEPQDG
jgi:hypothetical protein